MNSHKNKIVWTFLTLTTIVLFLFVVIVYVLNEKTCVLGHQYSADLSETPQVCEKCGYTPEKTSHKNNPSDGYIEYEW